MGFQLVATPVPTQNVNGPISWVVPEVCARGINVASFFDGVPKSNCCMCINTPFLSVGESMMVGLWINAHEHEASVGAWRTQVYGFLSTPSGGALQPFYSHLGNRVRTVRWAVNPSGYWCLLIGAGTGATLTDSWAYPHVSVDAMLAYGSPAAVNADLTTGWSITFPTDITSYTSLTTVSRNEA